MLLPRRRRTLLLWETCKSEALISQLGRKFHWPIIKTFEHKNEVKTPKKQQILTKQKRYEISTEKPITRSADKSSRKTKEIEEEEKKQSTKNEDIDDKTAKGLL